MLAINLERIYTARCLTIGFLVSGIDMFLFLVSSHIHDRVTYLLNSVIKLAENTTGRIMLESIIIIADDTCIYVLLQVISNGNLLEH